MYILSAADAEIHLRVLVDQEHRGPETISKNGHEFAIHMSVEAFEEQRHRKLRFLQDEVRKGLKDLERGAVISGEDAFKQTDSELFDAV